MKTQPETSWKRVKYYLAPSNQPQYNKLSFCCCEPRFATPFAFLGPLFFSIAFPDFGN